MIFDTILSFFMDGVLGIFSFLPDMSTVHIPVFNSTFLSDTIRLAGFVLPVPAMLPLFMIWVGLLNSKVIIAIIVRVKSFIPTMGA